MLRNPNDMDRGELVDAVKELREDQEYLNGLLVRLRNSGIILPPGDLTLELNRAVEAAENMSWET